MQQPLSEQILQKIDQAAELYHRLILVVAPPGSGKTSALQNVSRRTGCQYINVNLELSRGLLDLTERQRALQVPRLLNEVVGRGESQVALLDNIEILFDILLKQDPLRLLQGLSRNRTIVASWSGTIEGNYLTYAESNHPEYRQYNDRDILVVSP